MKIEIENIKTVYWKLKALADNLFINDEDEALEICAEHTDSYKFTNTHHKAKQEVEYLALNKNYSLLKSYYKKYKYCLDDIKETCSKYDNKSLRTQVNIYLIPTLEVFDEIKEHVTLDELKNQTKTLDNSQPNQNKEKLSQKQIALIHAYTGEVITDDNKNEIAKKHGWIAVNSGHKIKQLFDKHYYRRVDRIGLENTLKKTKNKIELIESIIDLLPKDKQQQALDEVQSLENAKNTEYL